MPQTAGSWATARNLGEVMGPLIPASFGTVSRDEDEARRDVKGFVVLWHQSRGRP